MVPHPAGWDIRGDNPHSLPQVPLSRAPEAANHSSSMGWGGTSEVSPSAWRAPKNFSTSAAEGGETGGGRTDAYVEAGCSHALPAVMCVRADLRHAPPLPPPPAPVADI